LDAIRFATLLMVYRSPGEVPSKLLMYPQLNAILQANAVEEHAVPLSAEESDVFRKTFTTKHTGINRKVPVRAADDLYRRFLLVLDTPEMILRFSSKGIIRRLAFRKNLADWSSA
jgi:hypothetical protein